MNASVRYGLYNGAASICWTMLMFVTGLNRTDSGQTINYIGVILPLIFIALAIKEYRLHQGHGYISFNQAFRQGFNVTLIGGVIGTIFMVIYMYVIDPGYQDFLMAQQEAKMADYGLSQEEIDKALANGSSFQSPVWFMVFGILGSAFLALVFGAIMGAILKKPNPEEIS